MEGVLAKIQAEKQIIVSRLHGELDKEVINEYDATECLSKLCELDIREGTILKYFTERQDGESK